MKLSHIDLSVQQGTLTDEFIVGVERLICEIFGWQGGRQVVERPGVAPTVTCSYQGPSLTLSLHEADSGLVPGVEDHVGFIVDRDELNDLASACAALASSDADFETMYLTDGKPEQVQVPGMTFHTFFVRCRLPLWFQFEHYEPTNDDTPT